MEFCGKIPWNSVKPTDLPSLVYLRPTLTVLQNTFAKHSFDVDFLFLQQTVPNRVTKKIQRYVIYKRRLQYNWTTHGIFFLMARSLHSQNIRCIASLSRRAPTHSQSTSMTSILCWLPLLTSILVTPPLCPSPTAMSTLNADDNEWQQWWYVATGTTIATSSNSANK